MWRVVNALNRSKMVAIVFKNNTSAINDDCVTKPYLAKIRVGRFTVGIKFVRFFFTKFREREAIKA
jgi:hypothetical protein